QSVTGIDPGIQGIFATCERGREPKCVGELYGLFEKCAKELYGLDPPTEGAENVEEEEDEDIEAAIQREISGLKEKGDKSKKLFLNVKLDLDCVVFFRTKEPCVPTEIVHALLSGKVQSQSMWTHRLTPISRTGKATPEVLEEIAREVLKPHFHEEGQEVVKYAIRPTSRNHNVMSRDDIIKKVADIVGPKHKVDLKNYDVLILVDIYKNICGMSVVRDFEKLGKYNLQVSRQLQSGEKKTDDKEKPVAEASKASEASEKKGKSPQKIANNDDGGGE
ncbi:hypothetical protein DFP73DRAFT_479854, partial [Morchella snyderi]